MSEHKLTYDENEEIKEIENGILLESITTQRNTHVSMILCPTWGVTCFMDDVIQSCEMDEEFYHHMLVFPAMYTKQTLMNRDSSGKKINQPSHAKRVMIVGGGEGATAREVLKWQSVEHIDMYDWDMEVVQLFQNKYQQWAKGAWDNPKLHLHFDNIFDIISSPPDTPYDVIIIDLFDPEEENRLQWAYLFEYIPLWASPDAVIIMYAGMSKAETNDGIPPYQMLCNMLLQQMKNKDISPYMIPMKSFMGDAVFLMLHNATTPNKGIQYRTIQIKDI